MTSTSMMLVQTTVPSYRRLFLETLYARLEGRVDVLAGLDYFDPTVRLDAGVMSGLRSRAVGNVYLFGRRVLWQRGVLARALRADVVVAELNPRILSTWLLLVLRRILRRPVVLWGHASPRAGPDTPSEPVRHLMRRSASAILAYTETEARELRGLMPEKLVEAAPNALYSLAQAPRALPDGSRPTDLLFVGRLIGPKKPVLLLDAFMLALDELPADTRLVFVGDGPLRATLAERAGEAVRDRVVFLGAVADYDELEALYGRTIASVIPGYAGLTLVQSLWFGVPAIIASREPHSPEIEAAEEGANALFFESGSRTALRDVLVSVVRSRDAWLARRREIASACASQYSVERMADAFVRVVQAVAR